MRRFLLALFILVYLPTIASAANRFAFCATTCTWDGSNQTMWGTATGGVGVPASVPGSGDVAIFDASTCVGGTTCTTTVNTTVTVQQITMGACTAATAGCIIDFSANNNNVTLSVGFSGSGIGVRTLNMGGGTWTVSAATGTIWDVTTATSFTLNANGSTLVFSGNPSSTVNVIPGAALNYNAVTFNASSNRGGFQLTSAVGTLGTLTVAAPNTLFFGASTTYGIASFAITGGSLSNMVFFSSNNVVNAATLSDTAGSNTNSFLSLRRMTFGGGATFTANSSIDLGGNSGITINAPTAGGGASCVGC